MQTGSCEYRGLAHGLSDVLMTEGFRNIYRGYFWYALHNGLNFAIQVAFYETMVKYLKRSQRQMFEKYEFGYIGAIGFVGGLLGSAITNPLEVWSVCKQACPNNSKVNELLMKPDWK